MVLATSALRPGDAVDIIYQKEWQAPQGLYRLGFIKEVYGGG